MRGYYSQRYATLGEEDVSSELSKPPTDALKEVAVAAMSARTVGLMMKNGGCENLLGLIKEVGAGQNFNTVLKKRYERDLPRLQEDIESELKTR